MLFGLKVAFFQQLINLKFEHLSASRSKTKLIKLLMMKLKIKVFSLSRESGDPLNEIVIPLENIIKNCGLL
jgi:hypothetical protein